jgi:cbb3-type cytochrome oxidase cytochrome c subunit/cytochrome c553
MTMRVVAIGGALVFAAVVVWVVIMPYVLWKPAPTIIANAYQGSVGHGRKLYYANQCNYCHTMYVRNQDVAMGQTSLGGNYVFDRPHLLGSERTGPDLSYIGRKRSEAWELQHLRLPRSLSPLSIMPNFFNLSDNDLRDIVAFLFQMGDQVSQQRMVPPENTPYLGTTDPIGCPMVTVKDEDQGWPAWNAAHLQEGKVIYIERCLTCHGCAGNGLGHYAGHQIVTPANYKVDPFSSMPDDEWFWHVSEGLPGTLMPVWKDSLSAEQRWYVIRYIQQQFARTFYRDPAEGDVPPEYADMTNPLPRTADNVDAGKAIWTRECMVCHGDAGRGEGPYREGLEPLPPDFHDDYSDFTDADYFWRISEGLPWTAMPAWKYQYSETDRWQLVHFIRSLLTQTQPRPPQPETPEGDLAFPFPESYRGRDWPAGTSYERGKGYYVRYCAHCHGLSGDGTGWDGAYLDPKPANLHDQADEANPHDVLMSKLSFGIKDTAMPTWFEWLPFDQRWDLVKYIVETYQKPGVRGGQSTMKSGQLPADYLTYDNGIYEEEGNTVSASDGKRLYGRFCSTCHGKDGSGNGPGLKDLASDGPAPFPSAMPEAYVFWREREGVPGSIMPAFWHAERQSFFNAGYLSEGSPFLQEKQLRDIAHYLATK